MKLDPYIYNTREFLTDCFIDGMILTVFYFVGGLIGTLIMAGVLSILHRISLIGRLHLINKDRGDK